MNNKQGVSFVEMLIVIALLGVITTLTLVNSSFINRYAVRAEIEKLYSVCRYLQQVAMTTNETQTLTFNVSSNQYQFNNTTEKLSSRVRFGTLRGVKGPPSSPRKLVTNPVTFKNNSILFHPDGVVQPGTVYVCDNSRTYVYALSSPIAQISYLRKYVYDGKWKLLN